MDCSLLWLFKFEIFGCETYALTPKNQRSKLDPRSMKCIFVGYDDAMKGYRLWDPTSHKIVISKDVIFYESSLIKSESVRVDVEQEHAISKQLIQLENQSSNDSKKQRERSHRRWRNSINGGNPITYTKKIIKGKKSS